MTNVWDQAVPELERAGGKRALFVHSASEKAVVACAERHPVLVDLVQMVSDRLEDVGVKHAMHLLAAVGVALEIG